MSSLFICLTPLQMLIVKRIIQDRSLSNCIIIVLAYQSNEKYDFYIKALKGVADKVLIVNVKPKNKLSTIIYFLKIKWMMFKELKKAKFQILYLASIDNKFVHSILSATTFSNLNTFDDGTANIISNSSYYNYHDKNKDLKDKILGVFYGGVDTAWVRNKSNLHYTLYENIPNIIRNTVKINLFNKVNDCVPNCSYVKKIFIGFPIDESNFTAVLINKILIDNGISHYFPHPREYSFQHLNAVEVIQTVRIIEDYCTEILNGDSRISLELYGFVSTSLLNLSGLSQRIKAFSFFDEDLMFRYKDYYVLAEQLGVNLTHFERE